MKCRSNSTTARLYICLHLIATLGVIAFLPSCTQSSVSSVSFPSPPLLQYRLWQWQSQQIHTLIVPASSQWLVTAAVSPQVDALATFTRQHQAIAAINAGFFDPQNRQTTAFVYMNGKLAANPKDNPKLVTNPQLKPYLPKIFNRSEFRTYKCQEKVKYGISQRSQPIPKGCQLASAVGGGPQLLPEINAKEEGFLDTRGDLVIRDPVGVNVRNARSAAGIMPDGSVILVMAAQSHPAGGLSLPQLQSFLKSQGTVAAIALDGGSSSSFYYRGKTFYGKVDRAGKVIQRPVKSVLLVREVTEDAAN